MENVCRECDEANPHVRVKGQRRTTCDACGYDSHWTRATPVMVAPSAEDEGPAFYARYDDVQEVTVSYPMGAVRDPFRLTLCCYAPARQDIRIRKVRGGHPPSINLR